MELLTEQALPAIFNPEDLHALEAALTVKDQYPDTKVNVITMGPPPAVQVLKESLYRGADFVAIDFRPKVRCSGYACNIIRTQMRYRENRQRRHGILRTPGYRRRYSSGWSPDGGKTRNQPDYLCFGN